MTNTAKVLCVWCVLIWPFLLPVVWPKIRKAKKQKEEETRQWWAEQERKSSMESVVIPETVTEIPKYAYSGYSSLKSVTIPASVRKIDPEALLNGFLMIKKIIQDILVHPRRRIIQ